MFYDPEVDLVSHSEVDAASRCWRYHYYGNVLNLSPENVSDYLSTGDLGHKALEVFYLCKKNGEAPEGPVNEFIQGAFLSGKYDFISLAKVQSLVNMYMDFYAKEDFEIIEVESYQQYVQEDAPTMHFIPDLVVMGKRGPQKGELCIIDHKFISQFMNSAAVRQCSQLPKYLLGYNKSHPELKANGIEIKWVMLNQIKTYDLKNPDPSKVFKREAWKPEEIFQHNVMECHNVYAREIVRRRRLTVIEQRQLAVPVHRRDVCQFCDFEQLCNGEQNGRDITREMAANYKPRDLTYREDRKRPVPLDLLWMQKN